MTYEDEILLEQSFQYVNMDNFDIEEDRKERNFYINIMMHTKDICDSDIFLTKHDTSSYDILSLFLYKKDGLVSFNGTICNEHTNKMIYGTIINEDGKYLVETNVYICNDFIYDEDKKEYTVEDKFTLVSSNSGYIFKRESRYEDGVFEEAPVEFLNDEEMENYLQEKCNKKKLKR